jgi:hypothetical protein
VVDRLKGKWYPAPVPSLPGESDVDYTHRLLGTESPYDHQRRRECALGYHRTCADRNIAHPTMYRGIRECPCHRDDSMILSEHGLADAVRILCDIYSLPDRTGWHVMHQADMLTGLSDITVDRVRQALATDYRSEISEGFALDVVQVLANKGPKGPARAFWKRVRTEYGQGQKLLSMVRPESERPAVEPPPPVSLVEMVRRAAEGAKRDPFQVLLPEWAAPVPKPVRLIELGPEWQDHPRYGERLRAQLSKALADLNWLAPADPGPPGLLGIPVVVDPSLPPGTWKMRAPDGDVVAQWPRVKLPGVETLAEALDRIKTNPFAPPPGDVSAPSFIQWLFRQSWFTRGVASIDASHTYGVDPAKLAWYIPATLAPSFRIRPGQPHDTELYGVKVRVSDKLRDNAAPILAFDLEETP